MRRKSVLYRSADVIERVCAETIIRANRRTCEAACQALAVAPRRRADLLERHDKGKTTRPA